MRRVYHSLTGKTDFDRLLFDEIVRRIQQSIINKKYLLVLDDIWDEDRDNWLDLLKLLERGASGSRVIVTTRSANVAKAVGTTKAHNLGLLTNEESWNLFKNFAFQSKQDESNPVLNQFGKEIVDSCKNVPLAIRVVGGLLYSKNSEKEWQQIRDARLSKAKGKEDDSIMQVLKLSYDCLPPALKQCFAYCSLFPKDYLYSKKNLAELWMAQGYIDPSDNGEEYFMELLGRNLFQDTSSIDNGEDFFTELLGSNLFEDPKEYYGKVVIKWKMHDLVHDLAQDLAGEEMKLLAGPSNQVIIDDGLIHVRVLRRKDQWEAPKSLLLAARNLRSILLSNNPIKPLSLEKMFSKFQSLRALNLSRTNISMVPNCVGKLRHLRFLDLSYNFNIKFLPDDITKLENLQTLDLTFCSSLKKLPRDFCKLSNLRHLYILRNGLIDLPLGFGKLKSLIELDKFIVGKNNGIDSLPDFIVVLEIEFCKRGSDIVLEAQRAKLKDNQQLTRLVLSFSHDFGETDEMLKCLQLPSNLIDIMVTEYKGVEMPRNCRWLDGLSKLVKVTIRDCSNCRVLSRMSQLPHLKQLCLNSLDSLEYIEDEDDIRMGGGGENHGPRALNDYFPSLELLQLVNLGSLKGWTTPSKDDDDYGGEQRQLFFPCLLQMKLRNCPKLMSMPLVPKLELLVADVVNWKWLVSNPTSINCEESSSSASSSSTTLSPSLKELLILGNNDATSIYYEEVFQSIACITTLQKLQINDLWVNKANNLKQLPEEMGKLSLLRELEISKCPKLPSLPKSLLDLTSLQKLQIVDCPMLEERYMMPNGQDCHLLQHIPNVKILQVPRVKVPYNFHNEPLIKRGYD